MTQASGFGRGDAPQARKQSIRDCGVAHKEEIKNEGPRRAESSAYTALDGGRLTRRETPAKGAAILCYKGSIARAVDPLERKVDGRARSGRLRETGQGAAYGGYSGSGSIINEFWSCAEERP